MTNKKINIVPINLNCLTNFPFIDETFDSITEYEMIQKFGGKLNEVIEYINTSIDNQVLTQINKFFEDKMIQTLYNENQEMLTFYVNLET